jgi:hypothetical protein
VVNRLYQPKSAVGTVLLAAYGSPLWGDSEEEAEWNGLLSGGAYDLTAKRVADLVRWEAPGADALAAAFKGFAEEAAAHITDYRNLVANFKKVQGAAEAAHKDWQDHSELQEFVAKSWSKVSSLYKSVKSIDPRWFEKGLYKELLEAEGNFLSLFSRPDYPNAHNALVTLQTQLLRAAHAVSDRLSKQVPLQEAYAAQSKRKDNLELEIVKFIRDERAQAFKAFDGGSLDACVRDMRLVGISAQDAVKSVPPDASARIDRWRERIDEVEAGLKKFNAEHPETELPELPFDALNERIILSDEVGDRYLEVQDAVLRSGNEHLTELKRQVELAHAALEDPQAKGHDGLVRQFNEAHGHFMQALATVDAVNGPAAQLSAKRVADLASSNLLPILNVEEKLSLLETLRGSCAPLAGSERPFKLTALGEAQAQLLASFSLDKDFRKVDRERRKKIATTLVANDADKRQYKEAQSGWIGMPEAERLKFCDKIVKTQCAVLGIEACSIEIQERDPSNAGSLDQEVRKIFINNHPQSAFHLSFEEVSNTLFHETTHWWQLLMVEAFRRGEIPEKMGDITNPEYLQIRVFAENQAAAHPSAYVSSGQDPTNYRKQPMEAHAFEVGDETQRLFLKALMH